MDVLGINSVYHESAACLVRDGVLVALAEEERFNRVKHAKTPRIDNPDEMPVRAIDYCLRQAGVGLADVEVAAYSSDPLSGCPAPATADGSMRTFLSHVEHARAALAGLGFRGTFVWVDHHTAHAASAYY